MQEDYEMKEKVALLTRRLEELENRGVQEVTFLHEVNVL